MRWYKRAPTADDESGKKVREAAAPFIEWLQNAEEEESADEADKAMLTMALEEEAREEAETLAEVQLACQLA